MTQRGNDQRQEPAGVYGTRDVARIVALPPQRIRRMVRAGLLRPRRDRRGAYRFSFQDIVLLRVSKNLVERGIRRGRIRRSMLRLRRQMPQDRPLSSVRIWTEYNVIFAACGPETWMPESGQILLNFGRPDSPPRIERLVSRLVGKPL